METEAPPTALAVPTEPAILDEKAQPHDTPLAVSAAGSTAEPATEKLAEAVATLAVVEPPVPSHPPLPEFITPIPGKAVQTPFTAPLPSSLPAPAATLTADQQKKYDELLATVQAWEEIPASSAKGAAGEALSDKERMWLTRECLLRYLRASKWNGANAAKRVQATLVWRREYGVYKHTPEYISPENETGKQVVLGYDIEGRPCLYLNPSKQNTARSDKQLHHLVFMLERVIELMPPGQETVALLINFKDSGGAGTPSVTQGKQTLDILQGHYPERLGRALISELPWYVTTFFKLISPFIDPVTKTKMKFNEPLPQHVPVEQLITQYGGKVEFEYDHSIYWPALNELCQKKYEREMARWEKAGKKIGELEGYLYGGEVKSLNGEFLGSES